MNREKGKQLLLGLVAVAAVTGFSGCASRPGGATDAAVMGVTTMGGAALGTALADGNEAIGGAIGALSGMVAGSGANAVRRGSEGKVAEEAYSKGYRDGQVEAIEELWFKETYSPGPGSPAPVNTEIAYPPGVYEGVLYGPRRTSANKFPSYPEPLR